MKVALFGGTGFVGTYLTEELLTNNHTPVLLVRAGSENKVTRAKDCIIKTGDVSDKKIIEDIIRDVDAIIYNIGLIRQFPRKGITFENTHFKGAKLCIDTASKIGVKRFILMSANGVKYEGTEYQSTKFLADQYLKNSALDWTIFRPSLIFGNPKGKIEFCTQLRDDMLGLPLPAPLFFDGININNAGKFSMSPIHISDVAQFFIKSLDMKETCGKIYNLGGPKDCNWIEIIDSISKASAKSKWKIPAPVEPIKLAAMLLDWLPFFPITKDQLTMLLEGNTCDSSVAFDEFDIQPTEFSVENLSYLSTP
ncbi:MAG: NAD(P)H-binding protein [Candidatus Marinimicrobia bacterium]|nr:NAD(P)H-binding protein [Candidatus Neomarinimicrobiota bacterium]